MISGRAAFRALPAISTFAVLSACVTARLYSDAELATVAQRCEAHPGEVLQEPDEKRLLFFYAAKPSRFQIHCLAQWAKPRKLRLIYIDTINWKK